MKKLSWIYLGALSALVLGVAQPVMARDCQVVNGSRVCTGDGGGHGNPPPSRPNPPPSRPNYPPPSRPNPPPPNWNPPGDHHNPDYGHHPYPPGPSYPPGHSYPPSRPPERDCYYDRGGRHCHVDPGHGGGWNPPPYRPPYNPPYNPPYYPPPYNPPVYNPPVYNPPTYRPAWDYYRVQSLITSLEYQVQQTLWQAQTEAGQYGDAQRNAAAFKVQVLRDAVIRLRDQLVVFQSSPFNTATDYHFVKSAFEDARQNLQWANFSQNVTYPFSQVQSLMQDLDSQYWGY